VLGWGLVAGVAAIAGLPPFGIFMSEFLMISTAFARQPILAVFLVLGLLVAFGAPRGPTGPVEASYVPVFAHLGIVLCAGIWLPPPLVAWFQHVAMLLG